MDDNRFDDERYEDDDRGNRCDENGNRYEDGTQSERFETKPAFNLAKFSNTFVLSFNRKFAYKLNLLLQEHLHYNTVSPELFCFSKQLEGWLNRGEFDRQYQETAERA
jgi:hypothetical protein